jgi:hypothetical protein
VVPLCILKLQGSILETSHTTIASLTFLYARHAFQVLRPLWGLELQGFLADISIWTGYATMALMVTGKFIFQFLGWKVAALTTPTVMLVSGTAFFGLSIAASMGGSSLVAGTLNLASIGALAGAVTQVGAVHAHV